MASDTPAAAITAVAQALASRPNLTTRSTGYLRGIAEIAVAAAEPLIRADEREACARLAEQESDYCGVPIAELIRARTQL